MLPLEALNELVYDKVDQVIFEELVSNENFKDISSQQIDSYVEDLKF